VVALTSTTVKNSILKTEYVIKKNNNATNIFISNMFIELVSRSQAQAIIVRLDSSKMLKHDYEHDYKIRDKIIK
jgi:hypothetical protein